MKKPQTDKIKLISYSNLAWTEPVIAPPEEYAEDTELFIKVIA